MPLLYFWRGDNYRRDLDYGAGYHLNQSNPLLQADISFQQIVVSFDFPGVSPFATKLRFFLSGVPAIPKKRSPFS